MNRSFENPIQKATTHVDQGLRAYMQKVFAMMGLGLVLSGGVAYFVASTPALFIPLLTTNLKWVVLIATFAIPLTLGMGINRLKASTAQALFWAYAALMGITCAGICLAFTSESIARVFLVTACMFGGMCLYGYTTKKDLTAWGSFLFMGLFGLIIASVVNLFIGSSPLQMALSVVSVIVFTGLTAYDVQMIRSFYHSGMSAEAETKAATFGALHLYLDFVNIFFALLRLFGDRR